MGGRVDTNEKQVSLSEVKKSQKLVRKIDLIRLRITQKKHIESKSTANNDNNNQQYIKQTTSCRGFRVKIHQLCIS